MSNKYPFYTEPSHKVGPMTDVSGNGSRDTATAAAEERLIVSAENKIFLLEPTKHPLVSLLTNVGKVWDGKAWKGMGILKEQVTNPEFTWFEDFYGGRHCRVASVSGTTGAVTITVTGAGSNSAYIFTPGDVVMNSRTRENFIVESIGSATTITVKAADRGRGSAPAATMNATDSLFIIGNVNEENGGARAINSTLVTPEKNYTFC